MTGENRRLQILREAMRLFSQRGFAARPPKKSPSRPVGQSAVFLVLERQTELTIARGNELRAQTDLNKAIAELQRATGNSLTANNVNLK